MAAALPGLDGAYRLLGVAPAHAGYVQLYARRGLAAEVFPSVAGVPAVLAKVSMGAASVVVAGAHCEPGPEGATKRAE